MASADLSTDYGVFVVDALATMTRGSRAIDQSMLQQCLGLSSSYLMTDMTMNPSSGMETWAVGFNRLVDIVVALHVTNQLDLETFNAATKACSECWTVAGSWRGFDSCKEVIRSVASKLKKLLDPDGRTYKGRPVYVP
ncbi:hypothetical protein AX16_003172 [Volvariella volvacea WC 439]|nr:hypothetical protein AX16_003172 [Volvariella volvacea WC 439]